MIELSIRRPTLIVALFSVLAILGGLSFFQLNDPVLEQIREELVSIDINTLTPVEALMKLNEIKKLTGG